MQENEYKIIINVDKYQSIKDAVEWDFEIQQVNHYYDTRNLFLYNHDITFRIRENEGSNILQIKHPNVSNDLYTSRIENEYVINEIPNHFSSSEFKKYIGEININETVYLIGKLNTIRLIKQYDTNIQICLDKNSFLGTIDYELEIEFMELTNEVKSIIEKLSIKPKTPESKYKRFINYYQQNNCK